MSKYTPGPWRYKKEDGGYGIYSGPYTFTFTWEFLDEETKTAQANARLIAAAPDLLLALMTADLTFKENGILACHAARQEIRAAIAKATGNE